MQPPLKTRTSVAGSAFLFFFITPPCEVVEVVNCTKNEQAPHERSLLEFSIIFFFYQTLKPTPLFEKKKKK